MSHTDSMRQGDPVSRASRRSKRRRQRQRRHSQLLLELLEDRRLLAQVTGMAWLDLDANGLQDINETGLAGAVVELYDAVDGIVDNGDDQSLGLQITNAAGDYNFPDVSLGEGYYLRFRAPAGLAFTIPDAGDEATDSDVDASGTTSLFSVSALDGQTVRDAGLQGSSAPFGFAFTFGEDLDDYGASITAAPDGNILLTGGFYGSVDFDPGPGSVTVTSEGDRDAFVASYTPAGALVWVRSIGGPLNDFVHAEVTFDDRGQMFLAGGFQGTVDFDPGPGRAEQTSSGGWDIFLLTLTAQGQFISVRQIGDPDPAHFEYISGMALDADGNLYATGSFEGTIDFDPGPGVTSLDVAGVTDAFFLKLDRDGQLVWAKRIGGAGWDHGDSLTLDAEGNIWSTGYYMGPLDFDPGPGVFELPTYAASELDAFVLKLDANGDFRWAGAMGGTSQDLGTDIQLDHHGNVLVALNFRYAADVDPGPGDFQVTGAITEDVAVVKLDPEGTLIWARVMAGDHRDRPTTLAIDAADSVYTVGEFRLTVDFDPGPGQFVLDAGPRFDYFLSKLDASGNFVFARQLGDPNYEDYGLGLALDDRGNIYSTGQFNGTVDFDWGGGTYLATSAGGYDGFLWRMSQASLQGQVWEDLDGDGIRSSEEPGLSGAVVEVWSTTDGVIGNDDDVSRGLATTDELGEYEFTALADGVDYYVTVRLPVGLDFTTPHAGTGQATQSDVDALGRSNIFPLGSAAVGTVNAGVIGTPPRFGFAFGAGGLQADEAQRIARDEAGNLYVAGTFSGTSADLDPGPDVRRFESAGGSDVVVAKYTPHGVLLWARSFGGPGEDSIGGLDLDARKNIYLSGAFADAANFDTQWGSRIETSAGQDDAYVVRLDEYGNLVWVRAIGGPGSDAASDVRVDAEGNVLVSGWFAQTVDLDPGPGTHEATATGSADGFILKLSAAGATQWSATFAGTGQELPQSLDTDPAGFVHVGGSFTEVADFDPGPGTAELTSSGGQDGFLVRLGPDGSFVWARSITSSDDVQGVRVRVDEDAGSYLVGEFRGQVDLDPSPSAYRVNSAGAEDVFFLKLDAGGSLAYGGSIGGPGTDRAGGLDVDAHGLLTLSGAFSETADFDPSSGTFPLVSAGETDAFVARFSQNGELVLVRSWGGPGVDEARDLVVDSVNGITSVGRFAHLDGQVVDFDPGPLTYQIEESGATGTGDWFVSHLDFQTLRVTTENDSGVGSLREAIHIANALPGSDRIEFEISGDGPHTIQATSELPDVLESVAIDGTTQFGYAGAPLVELRGDLAGAGATGLTIRGSDTRVTGLVINRFSGTGIEIRDAGTTRVVVAGNYIGTDLTGTQLEPNGTYGIRIHDAANNVIGGSGPGDGNVLGGSFNNLAVAGSAATGNVIQGNYIGVTSDGTASLTPDWLHAGVSQRAILIHQQSSDNTIGGLGAEEGNVIAGHNGHAIDIFGGGSNLIAGNRIGTNAAGNEGIGNFRGLVMANSPDNSVINNLVSGNYDGIVVSGSLATNTIIRGNYVGTDVTGTAAISNLWYGINFVNDPVGALIGGTTEQDRNLVSANGGDGIRLTGTGHEVYGNYVGTDITGTQNLGNENNGVYVSGASEVRVGSGHAGAGNLLSGNRRGVQVLGDFTHVRVQGNLIGTTADGLSALGNSIGISIRSSGNFVGSDGDGINDEFEGNVIAASSFAGIELSALNTDASGNVVAGNLIGTDITGSALLANATGIFVDSMADVRIGGTTPVDRNIISGSTVRGIMVQRMGSKTGVEILGNNLGTDVTGMQPLGNGTAILVDRSAGVVIGSPQPGGGNVISANGIGVQISGTGSDNTVIAGNLIGTNQNGTAALGNTAYAIHINGSVGTRIGGVTADERNVISGNYNGVYIAGSDTHVQGNILGLDVAGQAAIANFNAGILVAGGYGTLIGGVEPGAGNTISGNRVGIEVSGGTPTENTIIQGNRIGTDSSGTVAVGNDIGVSLSATSWFWIHDVLIGGSEPSAANLISGNTTAGVRLAGTRITGARIEGNRIGTNWAGEAVIGNLRGVVVEDRAGGVQIGSTQAGNLISGNAEQVVIVGNVPRKTQAFANGDWTAPAHQGWDTFPLPQGSQNPFWVSASNNTNRDTNIGEAGGTFVRLAPEQGQTTEPVAYYADTKLGGKLTLDQAIHADGEIVVTSVDGFDGRAGVEFFAQDEAREDRDRSALGLRLLDAGEGTTGLRAFASLVLADGTVLSGAPLHGSAGLELGVTYTWRLDYDPSGGTSQQGELVVEVFADGGVSLGTSRIDLTETWRGVGASLDAFGLRAGGGGELPAVESSVQYYVDQLDYSRVRGNTIVGNKIGSDRSGKRVLNQPTPSTVGIRIEDSDDNQIGGTDPGAGNLISGSNYGIFVTGATSGNRIEGNWIGTDPTGLVALPNVVGVAVSSSAENVLGGADAAAGNVIAYNLGPGVHLRDPLAAAGEIRNNRIFANLGRGIQLGDGAEPLLNDPGDTDGFLNFPVLTSAQLDNGLLTVSGFARPGAVIDLYLSAPTSTGFGQGETRIATLVEGSASDHDDATGSYGPGPVNGRVVGSDTTDKFSFTIPLPDEVSVGSLLTAVTIGSTSEFSAVVSVGDLPPNVAPVVVAGDGLVELAQGELLERDGFFIDDDSVSWTGTVDYGDGTVKPLSLSAERAFRLEHLYREAGNYTVTVSIVDNSLARGVGTFTVIIANAAPTATFNVFTITSPAAEGSTVALQGDFTDPGLLDIHTIEVDWGDGTPHSVLPIAQGDRSFSATHVYVDDRPSNTARDVYRVQVTVYDDQGGQDTTPLGIYLEDIFNVPPQNLTLTLSDSEVDESATVLLSGSFTDPGVLDTHLVSIDWGDGSVPEVVELAENVLAFADIPHVYPDDPDGDAEVYTITVDVVDDDEPLAPVRATIEVGVRNVAPFNMQLQTTATQIQENGTIGLSGSFSDPGTLDAHRVEIDWGDGSEPVVVDLPPNRTTFTGLEHRYADDSGAGAFLITVLVTDDDASGEPLVSTASVRVFNAIPAVESLQVSQLGPLVEGSQITVSGTYTDIGPRDRHTVEVYWGAQRLGTASVDSTHRSYVFSHVLEDDDPTGTPWDSAPIQVRVVDDDGATGLLESQSDLRVDNVAPQVTILPGDGSTETAVKLIAQVADPGVRDTFSYHWSISGGGESYEVLDGGPTFTLDRSGAPNAVYVVTLSVTDDDLGSDTLSMAVLVGTPSADRIVVTDDAFTSTGVNNLLVLGLGDTDVIDATAVSAGNHVVLDGGDGTDQLFGGSGNDVFFLRGGDDQANVAVPGGPPPNYEGDDRYYIVPNSTHTIADTLGANALDFTFAAFGVTFDLSEENVLQDVGLLSDAGEHFVQFDGTFPELVGSAFGDALNGGQRKHGLGWCWCGPTLCQEWDQQCGSLWWRSR